jgi:hypothetical protein
MIGGKNMKKKRRSSTKLCARPLKSHDWREKYEMHKKITNIKNRLAGSRDLLLDALGICIWRVLNRLAGSKPAGGFPRIFTLTPTLVEIIF